MAVGLDQPLAIPIVDLAPSRTGDAAERARVAKELYAAFKNVGFAYIQNHGIPQEAVDEAFNWSRKFFALLQSEKDKAPHPPYGWYHRGYSDVGREKVVQMIFDDASIAEARRTPDVKESFELGREDDERTPNIWVPEASLPGFRAFFEGFFFGACYAVELDLLRLVALGMGLEEGFFLGYHACRDNQVRLLHYPPVEESALRRGEVERIAAHSDFGTMTMLFQDEVGGLEVEDVREAGRFNPAPFVPGTVVVNIGDFLMRWSNDELKSTLHRVRAPPVAKAEPRVGTDAGGEPAGRQRPRMTRARYSIPYFVCADREKTIDCVPGCFGPDRPKKYEPIKSQDYIDMRMNATY